MALFSSINQFLPGEAESPQEIKTDLLKIRGKTLIFANSIYQIPNISALEVINLSTTKPIPTYLWFIAIVGAALLWLGPSNTLRFVGILALALCGYLFYQYKKNKLRKLYGLKIVLNAGLAASTAIISKDQGFLMRVALTLYNIMNSDAGKTTTINKFDIAVDQRKIIDLNNVSNSSIALGDVSGSIVNNVA